MKISELQVKDVVNVGDGKNLGNISDIEIDLITGKIDAVVISGAGRVLGFFGKDEDVLIQWKNIIKIGEDVILVRHKSTAEKIIEQGE